MEEHLGVAAALASNRYQDFRVQVPLLLPRYADAITLFSLLHSIFGAGPGVAAISQGRLVGFLTGWLIPSFRGRRTVFCPEWANAAEKGNNRDIYEEMYASLSASWVEDGYHTHLISTLADESDSLDVWHWLGFGMIAVDAVRSLQPLQSPLGDFSIFRGGQRNIEEAVELSQALQRPPGFGPYLPRPHWTTRCPIL